MPGPAPKSEPVRRNSRVGTLKLPAEGRKGPTPKWPLDGKPPAVWAEIWRTPQAVAWERFGWTRVVARYCKVLVRAETAVDPVTMSEARQLEDRLGLTPKAMRSLLWEIATDDVAAKREEKSDARRRIKAV
jgi:hypothetical protein